MSGTSVITKTTAEQMVKLFLRHGAELDALVADLQKQITGEEYKQARFLIGMVMGELYLQGMHPLFVAYPELKPPAMRD